MELSVKDMPALFKQLGLPSDHSSIDDFIRSHPLSNGVSVDSASFWNDAQADFLREEMVEDADWAIIVDELNMLLHESNPQG